MLVFASGNLFETDADIRINTVNCVGVMGKGVALSFKERYPMMFDDYKEACDRGEVQPGRLHTWTAPEGVTVVNFPTKRHWRQKSRYEDIEAGLRVLHDFLRERGRVRVTLPALGCGHGGLDWARVSQLIEDRLADLEAEIFVFGPSASRSADQAARNGDSEETRELLKQRGVRTWCKDDPAFPCSLGELGYGRLYLLGNERLLSEKWVSMLCSYQPAEREINAATMCAEGLSKAGVVVGSGYSPKVERRAIRAALEQGGNVVIFLADGILQFKQRQDLQDVWDKDRVVVVSVASPNQSWSKNAARDAQRAMVALSSCVLITDPEPKRWRALAKEVARVQPVQIAFVDYQTDATDMCAMRELSAIPIRRSRDTGAPNLSPILDPNQA